MKHQNLGCAFVNDPLMGAAEPKYGPFSEAGLKYYIDKKDNNFIVKLAFEEEFIIPLHSFSIDPYKFNEKSNQWPQWWLKSPFHGFPAEINEALEALILFLAKSTSHKSKVTTVSQASIDAMYMLDPLNNLSYIGAIYYNKKNDNILHDAYLKAIDSAYLRVPYAKELAYNLDRRIHPVNNFPENCLGFSLDADYFGILATKNEELFGVACTNNFALIELTI